ncbi:alkaline phosphatase family protein [Pelomonas sp. SE-A7]|uniref:alkaline phosphatase family protein n=1 Tax=Pelomonas sp. SE-A7 TaxID=3054953 RepID=UPI00259CD914|nr:alkaline phosphatase family protein [Pelomonas sp. SE-A7]MDM4768223.1 alkaline phosphatase family protein [Pelomonas sp. SE-A7]
MKASRPLVILSTLAAALLAGCASEPPKPVAPTKPKLLVFIVIDGLPMRQVTGYRDQFAPDGFRRFLDRGATYLEAHYSHAHTVTAAGHSVMLTGAHPQRTGIIGNEWVDPQTRKEVYNTQDKDYQYIGNKTDSMAGTSPRMLQAETVGDVLRTADPLSKVIGVSGKDRGAILPAGHKGQAYMFMGATGQFASSTYYMDKHPAWAEAFNAAKPADALYGKVWTPLLPDKCADGKTSQQASPGAPLYACGAYARSAADGQDFQSTEKSVNGNTLPAVIGGKLSGPGAEFYKLILPSPYGDELTLAFARAAVEGEQLGLDEHPDILTVSLSSHDYVNHAFGPESKLSHDHMLQLDLHLQAFFQYLDQRVGKGNYLLMLTADHGFADTPEWAKSLGRDAKRASSKQMLEYTNAGLVQRFGEGKWATATSAMGLLFDEQLIAQRGLKSEDVYQAAKQVLLTHPEVAAVFTPDQLRSNDESTPYLAAMRKSWHPDRAAPVQVIPKQGRLYSTRTSGSSHGTPYAYDHHVPILAWGPAWVGQGEVRQWVEVADIASTLSGVFQIPVPRQSQGKPLPLPR